MTTSSETTTSQPEALTFILRMSPSGVGYLSWDVGPQRRRKAQEAPGEAPEGAQEEQQKAKPKAVSRGTRERKSASRRKNTLDNLLFSLAVDLSLEAFCLFDISRHNWFKPAPEGSPTKWTLDRRGKPDLERLLKNFRARVERGFPLGWFFYRWEVRRSRAYGQPVLKFHLLGDPGPDHGLEEAGEVIRRAWLDLIKSDNPDLVGAQVPHENSALAYSAPLEEALAADLVAILQGQREFGRIHMKNMPVNRPVVGKVPPEIAQKVMALLSAHHRQYAEATGRVPSQGFLNKLGKLSGRACVNGITSPNVQELLGPYLKVGS